MFLTNAKHFPIPSPLLAPCKTLLPHSPLLGWRDATYKSDCKARRNPQSWLLRLLKVVEGAAPGGQLSFLQHLQAPSWTPSPRGCLNRAFTCTGAAEPQLCLGCSPAHLTGRGPPKPPRPTKSPVWLWDLNDWCNEGDPAIRPRVLWDGEVDPPRMAMPGLSPCNRVSEQGTRSEPDGPCTFGVPIFFPLLCP